MFSYLRGVIRTRDLSCSHRPRFYTFAVYDASYPRESTNKESDTYQSLQEPCFNTFTVTFTYNLRVRDILTLSKASFGTNSIVHRGSIL